MNENNNFTGQQPEVNTQQGFGGQPDFNNQPQQGFGGQPDFNNQPQQGFGGQPDFNNQPQQGFGGQPDFNNQPQQGFGGQPDFNNQPQQGFGGQPDFNNQPQQGFGGQPDFNNQPQQGFGGQPGFNQNPMQSAPALGAMPNNYMQPQQPKKSKAGLIVGIFAVLAVVAAAAVFMVFKGGLFGVKPENKIQKGVENIVKEAAEYNSGIAKEVGLEEISKSYVDGKAHTNLNLLVTIPDIQEVNNLGIKIDAITDNKNMQAKYNLAMSMLGSDMELGDLYVSGSKLYLSVPMLFDDVYSVDMTNFVEDFNDSAWVDMFGSTIPEDFSFDSFTANNTKEYEEEIKALTEDYKKRLEGIVKYSVNKEAKEIEINGETGKYTGVTASYDKDELNELIASLKADFMGSEYYNAILESYTSVSSGEEAAEFESAYNEIWDNIFAIRFEEDFNVNVYFDKKGRMVNISTADMIPVSGTDVSGVGINFTFSGVARTLDEVSGSIDLEINGQTISATLNRFGISDDKTYTEYIDVALSSSLDEEVVSFTFENNCDKTEKTFDIKASVVGIGDTNGLYFNADGYYTDITKGEGYTIQVNNASIGLNDEEFINVTGSITSEISDEEIEIPQDSIDILDMSTSEISDMFSGSSAGIY